jgi:hypothetical protein
MEMEMKVHLRQKAASLRNFHYTCHQMNDVLEGSVDNFCHPCGHPAFSGRLMDEMAYRSPFRYSLESADGMHLVVVHHRTDQEDAEVAVSD